MSSNNKGLKIAGGITLSSIAVFLGIYFSIADRASEAGEEKATVKMEVEAVSKRVDHLESHANKTEAVLDGKDGLVATVEVIKSELKTITKQGDALHKQNILILQKIDALPKK